MNSHFKNFNTSNTSFTLSDPHKGGFRVIAETTRNHIFSKEISQVMLAAMVLAPDFYCKKLSASDISYERKSAFS